MKRYISVNIYLLIAILGCFIALSTCTEDEGAAPDPKGNLNGNPNDTTHTNNNNDPNTDIDANAISDALILKDFTAINGNIPASSHLADLKLDKDAIFLVEGIKNRIRILYPPNVGTGSSSVYIQVVGAGQYFDVPLEEEESTDTVGVFYLEFDPDDWELPLSFDIEIAPHDDSGTSTDDFKRKVVVEKKGEDACSPWNPHPYWVWLWTWIDDSFYSAPGIPVGTVASTNGCCLEGYSVDCIANGIPESEWKNIDYAAYLMTNLEYLTLQEDGSMLGQLTEQTQNLDYSESNFCTGEPAYIRRTKDNAFWGEYTYHPSSRKVTFTNLESTEREIYLEEIDFTVTEYDKYYISPAFEYEIISCHFLLEISNIEGQERLRLFERRASVEFGGEYAYWYD